MLGYIAFVLLLFFPGLAAGLFLDLFQERSFVESLAIGFGLSLILAPMALLAGYAIVRGITQNLVYGILALSVALTLGLAWRNKVRFQVPRLDRFEIGVIALVLVQAAFCLAQLAAYPIFPVADSQDFGNHLQAALGFQAGQISLSSLNYPPAVRVLIASLLSVQGGSPLSLATQAMAIVASLAPLLIYILLSRLLGDRRLGFLGALLYVVTAVLWYFAIFGDGLFANFLGDMVTVAVLYVVAESLELLTVWRRVFVFLCGLSLLLSHFTTLVFIAALWLAVPVVWKKERAKLRRYLEVSGLITLPGVILAAANPSLIGETLSLLGYSGVGAGTVLASNNPISNLLATISPFLQNLFLQIGPGLFLLSLGTVILAAWFSWKEKGVWIPLLAIWFVLTWVTAPYTLISWRFAVYATLPMSLLWPLAVMFGFPPSFRFWNSDKPKSKVQRTGKLDKKLRRDRGINDVPKGVTFVVLLLIVGVAYKSPLSSLFQTATVNSYETSQSQQQVWEAMSWLGDNSLPGSQVLALNDWQFTYMTQIWGDVVTFGGQINASEAYTLAVQSGDKYVLFSVVSIPEPLSSIAGFSLYTSTYENYAGLKLLYYNPTVAVFAVTNSTA